MTEQNVRKPLSNFFVKKSLQVSIILKILAATLISTILMTIMLSVIYYLKSHGGSFYYMSNDIMEDLELQSILGIILPALISAQLVSLVIVTGIGLFSSRKAAVPVYKIEQWAQSMKNGKLNTHLAFRETIEMEELTMQCNEVAQTLREAFSEIKTAVDTIEEKPDIPPPVGEEVQRIRQILGRFEFDQN